MRGEALKSHATNDVELNKFLIKNLLFILDFVLISVDSFWPGFVLNNRLCDKILSWCWISFSKKVKVKLKKRAKGILCYFWHFFKSICFWPMKRLLLDLCGFRASPLTPLCPLYHHHMWAGNDVPVWLKPSTFSG